jgi:hypothetical protein
VGREVKGIRDGGRGSGDSLWRDVRGRTVR